MRKIKREEKAKQNKNLTVENFTIAKVRSVGKYMHLTIPYDYVEDQKLNDGDFVIIEKIKNSRVN